MQSSVWFAVQLTKRRRKTMSKAEIWFRNLCLEEKRNIICDHFKDCVDCPLFAYKDCCNITEIEDFFEVDPCKYRKEERNV